MILAGAALLAKEPSPDEAAIVKAMEGNVCRRGTYRRITAAIQQAAKAKGGAR